MNPEALCFHHYSIARSVRTLASQQVDERNFISRIGRTTHHLSISKFKLCEPIDRLSNAPVSRNRLEAYPDVSGPRLWKRAVFQQIGDISRQCVYHYLTRLEHCWSHTLIGQNSSTA